MRRVLRAIAVTAGLTVCLSAQGPPTITTSALPRAVAGESYSQALGATGGLRPYFWEPNGPMPAGMSLSRGGVFSGRPPAAGVFNFEVKLTDSRSVAVTRMLALVVAEGAGGLAITTSSLPAGTAGQDYSFTLQAGGGVPPYRWAGSFPSFLNFDEATGRVSGKPTLQGVYTCSVTVTDEVRASASATFTLTFRTGPPPLTIITPSELFDGTAGASYLQTFRASGGAPPYKWSILSGSTGGLTLNEETGDLRGTPEQTGAFTFLLRAVDSAGGTASQSYTVVVKGASLVVTVTNSVAVGTVGVSYNQRLPVVVSGGRAPYTWRLVSGQAPPGLTFNPSDQTITGTPTSAGTFNFSVQATDTDGLTAARPLSIVVNTAQLSITTTRQFPDGALNQPYAVTVEAVGGQPPYRWSASGLPAGLTINTGTGQISGTPTAAGEFPIAVTVVDSAIVNIADRFTMNVKLPALPRVTVSGLPLIASAGEQFPVAIEISSAYAAPLVAEAILTFAADTGPVDRTVQFASGGSTAQLTIPAGSTTAVTAVPLAIQTGTVAGTITITLRLQAGGTDITPTPAPAITTRVERAAPVISNVLVSRSSGGFTLAVSGYSTAREVTQVTFTFKTAAGQTLQPAASSITIPVDTLFGPWFQAAANSQYGSQFVYTQPFTVQGDSGAVEPDTVTLTNRLGSATLTVAK